MRQWAAISGKSKELGRRARPRMRATYTRTERIWTCSPPMNWARTSCFEHVKPRKTRTRFLEFCRYLRSLYPSDITIAIICGNYSPHLTTAKDGRVGAWASADNAEIAHTPANSSWLNRSRSSS